MRYTVLSHALCRQLEYTLCIKCELNELRRYNKMVSLKTSINNNANCFYTISIFYNNVTIKYLYYINHLK